MTAKQESDLLITSMITDWIGQYNVLLTINQNYDKIRGKKQSIGWAQNDFQTLFMNAEKPSSLLKKVHRNSVRKTTHTVQLQAGHGNCPINAQIRLLIVSITFENFVIVLISLEIDS